MLFSKLNENSKAKNQQYIIILQELPISIPPDANGYPALPITPRKPFSPVHFSIKQNDEQVFSRKFSAEICNSPGHPLVPNENRAREWSREEKGENNETR